MIYCYEENEEKNLKGNGEEETKLVLEPLRYFLVYKRNYDYYFIKNDTYDLVKKYLDKPLSRVGKCYIIRLSDIKEIERKSSKPKLIAKYSYIYDKKVKDNDNLNKDNIKILSKLNYKKNI